MNRKSLSLPPQARWGSTLATGLVAAAVTYPWWGALSPWLGVVIGLVAATVADMIWASRLMVTLPHVVILISCLQYGLAPWASHFYPDQRPEYQITNLREYFDYAGPVLAAVALGFLISSIGLRPKGVDFNREYGNHRLQRELDWLLFGGIVMTFFGSSIPGGIAFVVALLSNLRFVGAIGWMITAAPGWKKRVALVLAYEAYLSSRLAMFHDLILWGLSILAIYVFLRQLKRIVLVSGLAVLVSGVFFLQDAKWTLRSSTWMDEGPVVIFGQPMTFNQWTQPFASVLCLMDSATKFLTSGYSDESIANSITRFNQGWIIDRVIHHVPSEEPYARGETLQSALTATLLPRVLAPDKLRSDGKINMERFAGHVTIESTTMNIGYAGEMYANFGRWGGVAGCGVYALVLGLFFRWAASLARISPLWWAFAVFSGQWALKAETDIGGVLNYLVKSSILVFVVIWFTPALKAELTGRRSQSARPGQNGTSLKEQRARRRLELMGPPKDSNNGAPIEPAPVVQTVAKVGNGEPEA